MTARHLAAVDDRRDRPWLTHDHVADLIAANVVKHRLVVRRVVAVHGHHAHGGGRGRVVRQHHRRKGAWRKVGNGRQGQRVHLGQGTVGVHIALEVVANNAGPKDRPRLLPRHAVGLAGPPLHPVGDIVRDARGRHAVVEGQRLNRRTPEDGKNIDRDQKDAQRPKDDQCQRHDRHRIRVAQRCSNQSIHLRIPRKCRICIKSTARWQIRQERSVPPPNRRQCSDERVSQLASSAADELAVQWRLARVVVQRDVPGQPRLAPGGCRVPDGAHAAARFADPPQRCSVRNRTSAAAGASGKGDRDCVAAKEATNREEGEDGPGNTQAKSPAAG